MNEKLMDVLLEDDEECYKYMKKNDTESMRKVLLTTDRLRMLYCYNVCARRSVFWKIHGQWARHDVRYDYIRRWIKYGKGIRLLDDVGKNAGRRVPVVLD